MGRKWYRYSTLAKLNNNKECTVNYSDYYYYLTEEEVKEKTQVREFYDFDCAKVGAQDNMEYYMDYKPKTWYRKKEKIGFRLSSWWDDYEGHKYLTKEEFESYIIYDEYKPLDLQYYSLEKLMKYASADDFMLYMKDMGITTYHIIK
jgi:hypothetical protein